MKIIKYFITLLLGLLFWSFALPAFAQLIPFTSKQLAPSPVNLYCLITDGSKNIWSASCGSGGGSSGGTWSTTTSSVSGQFINYPNNTTDIVNIGSNSTTTGKYWFDPNTLTFKLGGNGTTTGKFAAFDEIKSTYFTATSTTATSTFPALIGTYFSIGGDTFNDLTGNGLTVSGGALNTTLGTTITPNELSTSVTAGNILIGTNAAGTGFVATGTPTLTVGNLVATSTTASSTFAWGISADKFNATSVTASSTFANGINLTGGCFSINSTCVSGSGGSGTVTSVATNNGLTGGTITNSGTLGLDLSKLGTTNQNLLLTWNGSQLQATGTPQLTVGYLTSTSTTATSTLINTYVKNLNNYTVYADQFPGATAGAKIIAATAAIPNEGGVVDATGLTGNQTISTASFSLGNLDGRPITYIFGPATYSIPMTTTIITVYDNVTIKANASTTFQQQSVGAGSVGVGGMFTPFYRSTTGSITSGTRSITVADASGFQVGKVIAITGAAGGNSYQTTTLNGAIDNAVTTIAVTSNSGVSGANYFLIDSEIVLGTVSANNLVTVTRGALGTTAASHSNGATVTWVGDLITRISAVDGTTITLEDPATQTVTSAPVTIGSTNISFLGNITMDGRQDRNAADVLTNPTGIFCRLCSNVHTDPTVVFKNFDHMGVMLHASWYNDISGIFQGIGRPDNGLGFGIIGFGQSKYNYIHPISIYDTGLVGISFDDRSSTLTEFDGTPQYNKIDSGDIIASSSTAVGFGIVLQGAQDNTVTVSRIYTPNSTGIALNSLQWTTLPPVQNNQIYAGSISASSLVADDVNSVNNVVYFNKGVGTNSLVGATKVIQDGFNFLNSQVGIGTTTPAGTLDVASTVPRIYLTDTNAGTNKQHWYTESNTGSYFISTSSDQLVDRTTSLFSITPGGKIGFGVNAPTEKLDLGGTAGLPVNLQLSSFNYLGSMFSSAGTLLGFNVRTDASAGVSNQGRVANTSSLGYGGILIDSTGFNFFASSTSVTLDSVVSPAVDNIMTISRALKSVGIGSTTPYAKLSVQGTAAGTTTLAIRPFAAQTANILDIYKNSTTLDSVIDPNSNWGIGTTSPFAKLSVAGRVVADYFTATSSNASTFPYASTTALTVAGNAYLGSLSGILKGTSGLVSTASNGTDYTLITAQDCTGTGHLLSVTASGVFTCSADSGGGGSGSGTVSTTTALVSGRVAVTTGASTIGNYSDFLYDNTLSKLTLTNASTTALSVGNTLISTSTVVCVSGEQCQFKSIQAALNAGFTFVHVKPGVISEKVTFQNDKTIIDFENKNAILQCNGATQSPCISTNGKNEWEIHSGTIRETNAKLLGIAFDYSDSAKGLMEGTRINNFSTSTYAHDSTDNTFYNKFLNVDFVDTGTCVDLGGTQANENTFTNVQKCRPMAVDDRIAIYVSDGRGLDFINVGVEGTTTARTNVGWYFDATSRDNKIDSTWTEAIGNGVVIANGANNIYFDGGSLTSNGTDLSDSGTKTRLVAINKTGTKLFNIASATSTDFAITNLANAVLAVNSFGSVIATTTGTVTSVATNNGLTGGTITTTGTLGLDLSKLGTANQNTVLTWNGTQLQATGTPNLTVGYLTATSTTATSTFAGSVHIGNLYNGQFAPSGFFNSNAHQLDIGDTIDDGLSLLTVGNRSTGTFAAGCITLVNANTPFDGGINATYNANLCLAGPNFNTLAGLPPNGLALDNTDGDIILGAVSSNYASSSIRFASGAGYITGNYDLNLITPNPTPYPNSTGFANLGLGTTTPTARFAITSSSTNPVPFFIIASSTNGTNSTVGTVAQQNVFSVNSNGRVGIGATTSPSADLSIGNTGASTITIYSNATSTFGTGGINLRGGCFAINGSCIGAGSGTTNHTALSNLYWNDSGHTGPNSSLAAFSSSGAALATSAPTVNYVIATSTTVASVLPLASSTSISATGTSTLTSLESTYFKLNGTTINTLAGNGLTVAGGAVTATLGTNITPNELNTAITTGNILVGTNAAGTAFNATGTISLTVPYLNATSTTASSTFAWGVQADKFNTTSTTASSTFANGINLTGGCFSINSTCVGGSGGSGTVTSVATNNGLTGGTITNTGTLGLDLSKLGSANQNLLLTWNGSQLLATGTPTLYAGNFIATTTATSTFSQADHTATTTFQANVGFKIASTTEAATEIVDWSAGITQRFILHQNTSIVVNATSSGPLDGGKYILKICQDQVGARTLTYLTANNLRWANGTTTISATANTCTFIGMIFDNQYKIYNVIASSTGLMN